MRIIVLPWHFPSLGTRLFYSDENKLLRFPWTISRVIWLFSGLQIPVHTQTTGPQVHSRKEFHDHSGDVSSSRETVNWISTTGPLARLSTKCHILHLLFQFMSQGNTLLLHNRNQKSPYQDFWRSQVHVRRHRVRIRIVSQCVVCVHSVGLGCCLFGCLSYRFSWFHFIYLFV